MPVPLDVVFTLVVFGLTLDVWISTAFAVLFVPLYRSKDAFGSVALGSSWGHAGARTGVVPSPRASPWQASSSGSSFSRGCSHLSGTTVLGSHQASAEKKTSNERSCGPPWCW